MNEEEDYQTVQVIEQLEDEIKEDSNLISDYETVILNSNDDKLNNYALNDDTMTNLDVINNVTLKECASLNNNDTCITRSNTALKLVNIIVDKEFENKITNEIITKTVTENKSSSSAFIEDVLQNNELPTSLVSTSSSCSILTNDPLNNNNRQSTATATALNIIRASTSNPTTISSRQGVSLREEESSELLKEEEENRLIENNTENLDGVQSLLFNGDRIDDNSNLKTVLMQNTVRVQSNSIEILDDNYSINEVPDKLNNNNNKEQRDLIANKIQDNCTSVINLKNKPQLNQSDKSEQIDQFEAVDDQIQTTDNLIDSFIVNNELKSIDRLKARCELIADSFLDCPNLVVNCNCELDQNNSASFLINSSNLLNSTTNLLLTTVDSNSTNLNNLNDLNLARTNEEPNTFSQIIQLPSHLNQEINCNKNQNQNLNQNNNLLATVLFLSENGSGLTSSFSASNNDDSTTGVVQNNNLFNLNESLTSNNLPLNARVLVIENLAQLNELTSGQNIILTTTNPIIQKLNPIDNSLINKEKTTSQSSVISHCSTISSAEDTTTSNSNKKRILPATKRLLKRQFAIDDNNDLQLAKTTITKKSNSNNEQKSDHVLVIKELTANSNSINSCGTINTETNKDNKKDSEKLTDQKLKSQLITVESKAEEMLDATDFRGVLNAAAVAAAVVEHHQNTLNQNTYQTLNGRCLTPPSYSSHSTQSQLAAAAASQQYATLQPLPPISTMSDKFSDKFNSQYHYVLNGNHSNNSSSAGNQSVIGATNCASNSVHPGFALMPNTTTLGEKTKYYYYFSFLFNLFFVQTLA